MPELTWLDSDEPLPPTHTALGPASHAPGLLAAGGRLTIPRLEEAYRRGVFPWFSPGQPVLWWSPDPRMVLPTAQFHLTHSLKKTLRRFLRTPGCELAFDRNFPAVIQACAQTPREGQDGTWIVPTIVQAYTAWHQAGRVHSAETWINGELVGGLYFVAIDDMVFGESMFAHRSDASKLALAALVAACRARGVPLASMGGHEISRADFEQHLAQHVLPLPLPLPAPDKGTPLERGAAPQAAPSWTYDAKHWDALGIGITP
jgi:leucyl/phenylalanyl-tRNA---protein transferase